MLCKSVEIHKSHFKLGLCPQLYNVIYSSIYWTGPLEDIKSPTKLVRLGGVRINMLKQGRQLVGFLFVKYYILMTTAYKFYCLPNCEGILGNFFGVHKPHHAAYGI